MKVKLVFNIVLLILFALAILFVVCAPIFVSREIKRQNIYEYEDKVNKLRKIGYLIIAAVIVMLLMVNLIF